LLSLVFFFFFFFQAEDGIRDGRVTGVQTCALPIWQGGPARRDVPYTCAAARARQQRGITTAGTRSHGMTPVDTATSGDEACRSRSEERRVGKECRSRGSREH